MPRARGSDYESIGDALATGVSQGLQLKQQRQRDEELNTLRLANLELARAADKREGERHKVDLPQRTEEGLLRNRLLGEQVVAAGQSNSLFPERQKAIRNENAGQMLRNEGQAIDNELAVERGTQRREDRKIEATDRQRREDDRQGQREASFLSIANQVDQIFQEAGEDPVLQDKARVMHEGLAKIIEKNPDAAKYIDDVLPSLRNTMLANKTLRRAETYAGTVEKWEAQGAIDPENAGVLKELLASDPERGIQLFETRRDVQNQETKRTNAEARYLMRVQGMKAEMEARNQSSGAMLSDEEEDAMDEIELAEAQLTNDKLDIKEMREVVQRAWTAMHKRGPAIDPVDDKAADMAKSASARQDDPGAYWRNFAGAKKVLQGGEVPNLDSNGKPIEKPKPSDADRAKALRDEIRSKGGSFEDYQRAAQAAGIKERDRTGGIKNR